jgi:hypothetical protein
LPKRAPQPDALPAPPKLTVVRVPFALALQRDFAGVAPTSRLAARRQAREKLA